MAGCEWASLVAVVALPFSFAAFGVVGAEKLSEWCMERCDLFDHADCA